MGLGGSLVVEAAALATVSVSPLPGIPFCPGIRRAEPVGYEALELLTMRLFLCVVVAAYCGKKGTSAKW